jgi:TPP-dependent pyruvate/acetoin dehydrogenase alpha subunit
MLKPSAENFYRHVSVHSFRTLVVTFKDKELPDFSPIFLGHSNEPRDLRFFRQMFAIRSFEQRLLSLFDEGILNGTTHACIGQEANCVGVISALSSEDHIFSNHRCHGHYLAKTGDPIGLLGEIMGRSYGVCGGLGGSQHLCATGFKSNGVLGGTLPGAAGIAMAYKLRNLRQISCVFLGDGVFGEGLVYETLNIAALWELPLFIIVEDNKWAQSTPQRANLAGKIVDRIKSFDICTFELNTTDVTEIYKTAVNLANSVRELQRPAALVLNTYRLCHHSKNDDYRPQEEVSERWKLDPLVCHNLDIKPDQIDRIKAEVLNALENCVSFVKENK